MIDPLVESHQDGLYRIRTYTPENVSYALYHPYSHSNLDSLL